MNPKNQSECLPADYSKPYVYTIVASLTGDVQNLANDLIIKAYSKDTTVTYKWTLNNVMGD